METIENNIGETSIDCPLIELLTNDHGDHDLLSMEEWTFDYEMIENEKRWEGVERQIIQRNGSTKDRDGSNRFSNSFVIQQATDRYFKIMRNSIVSIREIFSVSEILTIFSLNPGPVVHMNYGRAFASELADSLGIESWGDIDDNDDVRVLLRKLVKLTPVQNMALVDACEQFYRSTDTTGGVHGICCRFGLILNSD